MVFLFPPDSLRLIDLLLCGSRRALLSQRDLGRGEVTSGRRHGLCVWGGGPGCQPPMLPTAFPSVSLSDGKCCVFLTSEAQSSENRRVWELFSVKEEDPLLLPRSAYILQKSECIQLPLAKRSTSVCNLGYFWTQQLQKQDASSRMPIKAERSHAAAAS